MSWQDASIAITGTFLVIVLGSVLIWQIFKTAQVVLAANGQIKLEERRLRSIEETAAAQQRLAVDLKTLEEQVDTLSMKDGEYA